MPFQYKLILAFPKSGEMDGEFTASESETCLRIPEHTKDSVVLTSLQTQEHYFLSRARSM